MHHFRDPKVWREGDSWYMIVGAREGDTGQVRLYRSADLRQWQDAGVLDEAERDGLYVGCPDFFTLNGKRVLMFSPQGMAAKDSKPQSVPERLSDRRVAAGAAFVRQGEFVEMDHGHDFYAPQSFLTPMAAASLSAGWICGNRRCRSSRTAGRACSLCRAS
jgi:beta-fructofuranosidase